MDRYLMLQEDDADEKRLLEKKMLTLIDLYYDALDASKSGKKVIFSFYHFGKYINNFFLKKK